MGQSDAMLSIVISECSAAVKAHDGDLKSRLLASMNAAKDHWMVLDRETQFRGAVGAVMQFYGKDSEEWKRIAYEINMMKRLSALINAAEVGLKVSFLDPIAEETPEPIGLMKLWNEVTKPVNP